MDRTRTRISTTQVAPATLRTHASKQAQGRQEDIQIILSSVSLSFLFSLSGKDAKGPPSDQKQRPAANDEEAKKVAATASRAATERQKGKKGRCRRWGLAMSLNPEPLEELAGGSESRPTSPQRAGAEAREATKMNTPIQPTTLGLACGLPLEGL